MTVTFCWGSTVCGVSFAPPAGGNPCVWAGSPTGPPQSMAELSGAHAVASCICPLEVGCVFRCPPVLSTVSTCGRRCHSAPKRDLGCTGWTHTPTSCSCENLLHHVSVASRCPRSPTRCAECGVTQSHAGPAGGHACDRTLHGVVQL